MPSSRVAPLRTALVAGIGGALLGAGLLAALPRFAAWAQAPGAAAPGAPAEASATPPGAPGAAPPPAADNAIPVQVMVISPGPSSRSALTGSRHSATIDFALHVLGQRVQTPFGEVRIEPLHRDDGGRPAADVELAQEAQQSPAVVAVLGPVNSSSTQAFLAALAPGYALPVLSSLSTAPVLTDPTRSPNFFRLIFNDADRMRWYAAYLTHHDTGAKRFLLLYENDDAYGLGLRDTLSPYLTGARGVEEVTALDWCALREICAPAPPGAAAAAPIPLDEVKARLKAADGFVLLGVGEVALRVVDRIRELRGDTGSEHLFFVGQNPRYFELAPERSVTIGDPALDVARAPTPELRRDWSDLLDHFHSHTRLPSEDFLPTAYEAVMTLRSALARVLAEHRSMPPYEELREELRAALAAGSFRSLEPWRRIEFAEGDLASKPEAPIYRIERMRTREDGPTAVPWVELSAPKRNVEMGTGPVVIEATLRRTGLGDGDAPVRLSVDGVERALDFGKDGHAQVRLPWLSFGTHRVHTAPMPSLPADLTIDVTWPASLVLALLTAGVGGFLAIYSPTQRQRTHAAAHLTRIAVGMVSGLLLTLLSFFGPEVSRWFPYVSFSEAPPLNAAITGFVGGVAGPSLLLGIAGRVARLFGPAAETPPATPPDATRAPAPETLRPAWRRVEPGAGTGSERRPDGG